MTAALILTGIEVYGEIIRHPEKYYFSHKWTLKEFLTRDKGVSVFCCKKPEDYLKRSYKQEPNLLEQRIEQFRKNTNREPELADIENIKRSLGLTS